MQVLQFKEGSLNPMFSMGRFPRCFLCATMTEDHLLYLSFYVQVFGALVSRRSPTIPRRIMFRCIVCRAVLYLHDC